MNVPLLRGDINKLVADIVEVRNNLAAKHSPNLVTNQQEFRAILLPALEYAVEATISGKSYVGDIVYQEVYSYAANSYNWYNQDGTGSGYTALTHIQVGDQKRPQEIRYLCESGGPIRLMDKVFHFAPERVFFQEYFEANYKTEFEAWRKQTRAVIAQANRQVSKMRKEKRVRADFGRAFLEDIEKNVKAADSTARVVQETISDMDPVLLESILRLPPALIKYLGEFLGRKIVTLDNLNQETLVQMQRDLQVKKILTS